MVGGCAWVGSTSSAQWWDGGFRSFAHRRGAARLSQSHTSGLSIKRGWRCDAMLCGMWSTASTSIIRQAPHGAHPPLGTGRNPCPGAIPLCAVQRTWSSARRERGTVTIRCPLIGSRGHFTRRFEAPLRPTHLLKHRWKRPTTPRYCVDGLRMGESGISAFHRALPATRRRMMQEGWGPSARPQARCLDQSRAPNNPPGPVGGPGLARAPIAGWGRPSSGPGTALSGFHRDSRATCEVLCTS
jgi:hypothetical protein